MHCNSPEHFLSRRKMLFHAGNALSFLTFARRGDGQESS